MSKTIIIHATVPEDFNPTDMRIYDGEQSIYISPIEIIQEPTDEEWLKMLYDDIISEYINKDSEISKRIAKNLSEMRLEDVKYVINKLWRKEQ